MTVPLNAATPLVNVIHEGGRAFRMQGPVAKRLR